MLLVASYAFYAAWDWRFCGLLAVSTVVDFFVGRALAAEQERRRRRWIVTISVVVNLAILGFFKYAGFFSTSFSDLMGALGWSVPPIVLDVVLPVGISFYTFQTMSYSIDVYRRRIEPTRRFLDFALYVAFFPQLVAGPIERPMRFLPQILQPRDITWEKIGTGAWLVLWGLFKKAVLADNLAALVDGVYAPDADPTSGEIMLATWGFAFQIYCDFSGYTDIARGVARIMGFDLMVNFNLPFWATSIDDYWRRWHISLSTWLRDYLYIPLGGNRAGKWLTYRNLFLTMLLGGLWHGAAWTYVLWGAFHGVGLCLHRLTSPWFERIAPSSRVVERLWWALRVLFTFNLIAFAFVIFRSTSMAQLTRYLGILFGPFEAGMTGEWIVPFVALTAPLMLLETVMVWTRDLEPVRRWPAVVRGAVYAACLLGLLIFGEDGGNAFIYFQF
jgi:D-alanyl-lipoteichoic acid acyltransferase DltB (MBOAT superfamily)